MNFWKYYVLNCSQVCVQMANDYIKQPFGMNIKMPVKTIRQIEQTAESRVNGIFEPLFNFIEDNQNVFTGDVSRQIDQYNALQYNIGAELRALSTNGGFDVKG